jgi:hypothetical protein
MRLCAARDLRRSEPGELNAAVTSGNAGPLGPHFDVAKTRANTLESEIVRCVLAPPERVCLEIML